MRRKREEGGRIFIPLSTLFKFLKADTLAHVLMSKINYAFDQSIYGVL